VHEVGDDVVEQPLVVSDHQEGAVGTAQRIDSVGDDLEGVDVEAGVGLVEDREGRLEDRHLEDLVALLLAAGEAIVDRPFEQRFVEPDELHPLAHQREEVHGVELRLAAVGADRVEGGAQEVGIAHPGDFDRVLEGQEQPLARPLLGVELEEIAAAVVDLARGDLVPLAARERLGERALAGPVRTHDRVDLAGADAQVDPVQDLLALDRDVQVLQLEQ